MGSGDCICLALYDWRGAISIVQFHDVAKDFFALNHVVPDVGGLSASDSNDSTIKYSTIKQRIGHARYANASSLELYHTLPNYGQLVFGWDVTAGMHIELAKDMYFCASAQLGGTTFEELELLATQLSKMCELRYGIGYRRPFSLGPDLYALGMNTAPDYSEAGMLASDRIGAWFRERIDQNRHLQGYLRDVYPMNVLSDPHLRMPVNGVALADWIRTSADRGTLRPLAGGAWLWRVDEQHVPAITAELEQAGLLIAALGATR